MAGVNNQDTQQPKRAPITISGYPQAALDMMRARHPDYDQVMGGGNQVMQGAPQGGIPAVASVNVFQQGGNAMGKFQPQPLQTGAAPVTDFTQMQKPEEFVPQGNGYANPSLGPVQTPYMGDAADNTPQPHNSFEGMKQPTGWNEDGTPSYDALSSALSGYQITQSKQVPEFEADPSQRDGGFFGWLGKLIPKNRPGMREDETPDEYDRRMTTNRENIAAFADAIRHMANIVNTSKGAPLQKFNDPTAMMEQGYQYRKAQRQKQAAIDADAYYKLANLSLKQRAAEAQRAYQQTILGYKQKAEERAAKNDEFNRNFKTAGLQRQLDNDKFNQAYKTASLEESVRSHKASEGLRAQSNAISSARLSLASAKFAYEQAKNSNVDGKSIKSLPTANGYITRNNDLSTIEKKAIWQWMDKKGWLTKEFKSDWDILTPQQRGEKINGAIAWAARQGGARGKMFLDLLQRSYRYKPVNASANNGSATVNNGKRSVVTVTSRGNKGKTTKNNTVKNKFHVD